MAQLAAALLAAGMVGGVTVAAETGLETFEQNVRLAESRSNAYSPDLSESLLAYASALYEAGYYDAAAQKYRRSLHIERVNRGLFSTDLTPLYEALALASLRSGDAESATVAMRSVALNHIRTGKSPADSDETWRQIDRIARWSLSAYLQRVDPRGIDRLMDARHLFAFLLDSFGYPEPDASMAVDRRYFEALIGFSVASRYLGIENANLGRSGNTNSDAINCERLQSSLFAEVPVSFNTRGNNCMDGIWRDAAEVVAEAVRVAGLSGDAELELDALLYQADWSLRYGGRGNGARSEAMQLYEAVWQHFAGDERVDLTKLGQPERILDVGLMGPLPDLRALADDSPTRIEIPVRMRITQYGEPRDVVLADPDDPLAQQLSTRVLRSVRADLYRPAMVDGVTVDFDGFEDVWYAWSQ